VKRILVAFGLAVVIGTSGSLAAREEPAQPCPILKVIITEFPANEKLMLHPTPESHRSVFAGSDSIGTLSRNRGIRIAVLWENRTGEPLHDVTLRLEYQQAKTQAVRTTEQQFHDLPIKGHWTNFDLNGGEYRDTVHVAAWRVSVFSGDRMLGTKQSVMWPDR